MCRIEGGIVHLGAPPEDPLAAADERPMHPVRIEPFLMQKTPVTVGQYSPFLEETGAAKPLYWDDPRFSQPEQPVVGVSWFDARDYAAWAGLRLPTEAEWEWSARGPEGRRYPWGDRFQLARCATRDLMAGPAPVGAFPMSAGPWGVEELIGNLAQWVADPYEEAAYARAAGASALPQPNDANPYRVLRGGGWMLNAATARCTRRMGVWAEFREAHLGFRCVRDVTQPLHSEVFT